MNDAEGMRPTTFHHPKMDVRLPAPQRHVSVVGDRRNISVAVNVDWNGCRSAHVESAVIETVADVAAIERAAACVRGNAKRQRGGPIAICFAYCVVSHEAFRAIVHSALFETVSFNTCPVVGRDAAFFSGVPSPIPKSKSEMEVLCDEDDAMDWLIGTIANMSQDDDADLPRKIHLDGYIFDFRQMEKLLSFRANVRVHVRHGDPDLASFKPRARYVRVYGREG